MTSVPIAGMAECLPIIMEPAIKRFGEDPGFDLGANSDTPVVGGPALMMRNHVLPRFP